jgi:hypothetical protein
MKSSSKVAKCLILPGLLALAMAPSLLAQTVTVFASGFNNPRGLKFGPDGNLYVAEGGAGGTASTIGSCTQVVPPIGPYTGGYTGRISKVTPNGTVTTFSDNLPSSATSASSGAFASGVGDLAFVGQKLYAVLAGAGCSHGLIGTDNGVLRVKPDGTTTMVADLSKFVAAHPVANPEPGDFEPDGTWYSMVNVNGTLYTIEPNHGELDAVSETGIRRVADISNVEGHIVPTALAYDGKNFFVGNLDTFPHQRRLVEDPANYSQRADHHRLYGI